MLFIVWTLLCALGLARVVRLIVQDTWPPVASLRMKLFLRFPPAGLHLTEPEEVALIATDAASGFSSYQGREITPVIGAEDQWYIVDGHWFGELFDCHHCFGGWAAIPATLFWYFASGTLVASTFAAVSISPFVAILVAWAAFWYGTSYLTGNIQ